MSVRSRVIHVTRGFEDYLISLLNQLSDFVDISLVLANADLWVANHIPSKIDIIESKAPKVSSLHNLLSLPRIANAVKKIKPQIIHCQSGLIWEALTPRWGSNAKLVTTVHDVIQHPHQTKRQFTPQFILDSLAKRSDAIIVHGSSLRTLAQNRYNFNTVEAERKIHVINHPIISRYGSGQAKITGNSNVLFFGTLDRWKGIEVLLPALEILSEKKPELKIRIAGNSQAPEYYRQLPYKFKNIQWDIRRQSGSDIASLFNWADVIVLPYIEASQSGVLHVAQSFAVPIVASKTGAIPEVIKHEHNGLLIPPNTPASLAEGLLRMLTDNQLRKTVIDNLINSRNLELKNGSVGKATFELYQKLMSPQSIPDTNSCL